jgi:uncharacterized delta-60 repeat protein
MTRRLLLACALAATCLIGTAQDGSNDPTFNPTDIGFGNGDGAYNDILCTAVQADGKIIIGGEFISYNGTGRNRIARLNADGSLDTGFDPGTGANGIIQSTTIQADGKIIIGGEFTSYNGTGRNYIARVNADGSLDTGFNPVTGASGAIRSTAVQSDGKIIIGGSFTSYNGTGRNNIARLNADGSLDTGFDPGTGANDIIWSTAVQSDGKIIIGGGFTSFNGTARNRIARLNADGSLDTGFDPGLGASNTILSITVQADGKIIIGGDFTSYNGTGRNRIARLNTDGSLDISFNPGSGTNNTIYSTAMQADGKMIIGGQFTSYNGVGRNNIARLNTDGSLDTGFDPGTGANAPVYSTAVQADGKIIIAGNFNRYNGTGRSRIARLNADGSIDTGFDPGTGANAWILSTAVQADGKIIIGGAFTSYNGTVRNSIARLNADGSLDTGFDPGAGASTEIHSITMQADGKIIIGGTFISYNYIGRSRIARLNADGSLDTGFNPGSGANNNIYSTYVQADGKVIIGGSFTSYNGTVRNRIARLNADGSLDTGFNPGTGANGTTWSINVQADGKIIIGGSFTSYNGTVRNRIARLNADGSLDTLFNPGSGANNSIYSSAMQADGKIIIAGNFTSYNGTGRIRIARLNTDGSLDTGFNLGTGANGSINCIAVQADGRIIIGGLFTSYNGMGRNRIARLNANGSLDTGFNPGSGANSIFYCTISSTAVLADGKIIIGGWFTSYNGIGRNRIARINNTISPGAGIRVLLEGPYTNGLMNDALRTLPSFPLTEPFSAMGYANAAYTAGATMPASVLATTGNNAIVDWVLVEMRPASSPGTIVAARPALLQRDGDVVALDGTGQVTFPGLANGSYCLAVRPRNHLPVMLATTAPVNYTGTPPTVDFTLVGTQVYDADARKNVSGVMVLAAGDVTFNGTVSYVGSGNDRDPILLRVGGGTPTNTASGYWREDTNLDGVVKYIGAANDRDIILQSIGGIVPSNTRVAGLP